jgi:serine/threonine-protein kinase
MDDTTDLIATAHAAAAFDATLDAVASPSPRAGSAASPRASIGRTTGRTTVLPTGEPGAGVTREAVATRPRFQVRRSLGAGGIGEVVAAVDQDIGREVAIKSLRPDMQGSAHVARFVDEIRTVGALEHPNIVPIHDVGVNDDGSLYFVMRCVQGETLESIIERLAAGDPAAHAHWTMERRTHVFRQLLDAVAFAHERGFVHRDIKPANVMVGHHGEVFLMDWGIAKPIGASESASALPPGPGGSPRSNATDRITATGVGAVIGTPAYMSPEQARGEPVDVRSDIYSLCVLFHELLCLRHYLGHCQTVEAVLDGVQNAHAASASFVPSPHQGPAPMELSWFVHKGLAKHPDARYPTVQAMIDRLDARDEGVIPVQCPVTFTKRSTREFLRALDRHPVAIALALMLVPVVLLTGVVWHWVSAAH